jgi:alpha-ketoglutarate-dependent taurine dioxygenase
LQVEIIKPHIGAIVYADREELKGESVQRCLQLLEERGVLVFPQIYLTDAEQLAFTDRLGSRVDYSSNVPGGTAADSDVYKITLDPVVNNQPEYVLSTFFWHFDGAHGHIPPPRASLLSAHGVAAKGGQTEFCNLYVAYHALPEAEKAELEGLRVVHSIIASMRPFIDSPSDDDCRRWIDSVFKSRETTGAGYDGTANVNPSDDSYEKEHPLVWAHASGRKSLVIGVSADRIVGRPLAEGRALLSRLLEWSVQPDFIYRHQWQEGDLVVCNNPGALHRVIPYEINSGRAMHRTTVAGVELVQ